MKAICSMSWRSAGMPRKDRRVTRSHICLPLRLLRSPGARAGCAILRLCVHDGAAAFESRHRPASFGENGAYVLRLVLRLCVSGAVGLDSEVETESGVRQRIASCPGASPPHKGRPRFGSSGSIGTSLRASTRGKRRTESCDGVEHSAHRAYRTISPKCSRQARKCSRRERDSWPSVARVPVRFASAEELIHSGHEVHSGWRSRFASGQNLVEGNRVTIHSFRVPMVLMDDVTV